MAQEPTDFQRNWQSVACFRFTLSILPPIRFDRRIPNDLDSRLKRSLTTLTVACAGRFRSPGHVPAIGNVPARNGRGVAAFRSSSIIKEHGRVQSENTTLAGR